MPDTAELAIEIIREAFRTAHHKMRELVSSVDEEALNWQPHPEANSIAVLVTHSLGAEREMLAAVRGIKEPRDRSSEFGVEADAAALETLVELADGWLDEQMRHMTGADLAASRPRGDNPPRPGMHWLVTMYGHTREHIAHMELTKQLYEARRR